MYNGLMVGLICVMLLTTLLVSCFQLSYDLGTYFFYQEVYHQALEMFKETKDLLKHVSPYLLVTIQ